jgi:hypothetical protein
MTPSEKKVNTLNQIIEGFISDIKSAGAGAHIVCVTFDPESIDGDGRTIMDGRTAHIAPMLERMVASLGSDVFRQLLVRLASSPDYAALRREDTHPVDPKKVN